MKRPGHGIAITIEKYDVLLASILLSRSDRAHVGYEEGGRRYPGEQAAMDRCEITRSNVVSAIRGEVSAEEQQAFDEHIAACHACSEEVALLRGIWDALGAAPSIAPPSRLRDSVLSRVAAAREREASVRAPWAFALRSLVPGLAAALASVAFVVLRDPGCRSPLALACCGALWAGAYALAFAVLTGSRRRSPARALAGRGLLAAAGGLFLTGVCPDESGRGFAIPIVADIASAAATSPGMAFALGVVLAALPLLAVMLVVPARRPGPASEIGATGIYLGLLAPALYLQSSFLAFAGLLALVAGAALGALAPALLELRLRRPSEAKV